MVKQYLHIVIFIFALLCLTSSCSSNAPQEQEMIDTNIKQGKNYKILSNEEMTAFHYYVKDNNGYIIDEGYHDARGSFDMDQKGDFVTLNYGYGGNSWQERYYDVSNGQVSRFFERPIQRSDELVAYFSVNHSDQIILVVQNIFDPNKYYKEIIRDFSDHVIKDEAKAAFSENNTKLEISYWAGPDHEWVSEIIDLE